MSQCSCNKRMSGRFNQQTSIEEVSVMAYHPISNVQNRAPIDFDIPESEQYIDTNDIQLHVHSKIIRTASSNIAIETTVAPVSLLLHSMFSQLDISPKGTLISNSTNTNPYRAMLKMLMSYGGDAKSSQLTYEMYYKDPSEWMEATRLQTDNGNKPNAGLQA